eukprot:4201536-Amphidinium_carterae.1
MLGSVSLRRLGKKGQDHQELPSDVNLSDALYPGCPTGAAVRIGTGCTWRICQRTKASPIRTGKEKPYAIN